MGNCASRWKADVETGQESDIGSRRISLLALTTTPFLVFPRARGRVENKLKDVGGYLPLYKAALRGEWEEARKFLDKDPEALKAKITITSETALHISVGAVEKLEFIETLIRRMTPEDLALTDQNGETALSVAAVVGNVEAAKLLVNKNPDLPNIYGKSGLPIHRAAQYGQEKMIKYLLGVTRSDIEPCPFAGRYGAQLLIAVITAEFYDIALDLIEQYPDMATAEEQDMDSPLTVLASKRTAFPSGSISLTPWKKQTYNPVEYFRQCGNRKRLQRDAIDLVRSLCAEILQLDDAKAFDLLQKPLLIAANLGIHEIIEEIVEAFPPAIWASDEEKRNVFQLAVLNRRENVFNLIYQMSDYKHLVTRYTDQNDNNILHLAGQLPSPDRLRLVSGAALQVQRELQWYKVVEEFVEPAQKEAKNKDGKTPWIVFREKHQDLMKEGEKWMKGTATACTVASTLITTVVFSAAVHVPGGTKPDDGSPIFRKEWGFLAFAVTDAISLFASVTAIIWFLSILTSRYSEKDFLKALPKRLIIGLMMLFLSIISMTMAFSSAIYMLFGHKRAGIMIIIGASAVLGSLCPLMLPLLIRYVKATYGRGIFRKQKNRILH